MNESLKAFIVLLVALGIIIGGGTGIYFFCKWNNPWVDQIRDYCPDGTELTDYSYARSHLGIDAELYGLECDGVVMNFKVKIDLYQECEGYNKWDQCNRIVTKYNSTKRDASTRVDE